jgi:NTP pyrophosphatase (non-canonical NTP hydrolase)
VELNEYQKETKKTAIYPNAGNNLIYPVLGLNGEAGEVAEKLKKFMRDDTPAEELRSAICKELGDCLWYVAQVATELGLNLDQVATLNLMKLRHRHGAGTLNGSGDER